MCTDMRNKEVVFHEMQMKFIVSILDSEYRMASLMNDRDMMNRISDAQIAIQKITTSNDSDEIDQKSNVIEFLENTYTGANMSDDFDMMVRTARAMKAFELDTDKDVVIKYKDGDNSDE